MTIARKGLKVKVMGQANANGRSDLDRWQFFVVKEVLSTSKCEQAGQNGYAKLLQPNAELVTAHPMF